MKQKKERGKEKEKILKAISIIFTVFIILFNILLWTNTIKEIRINNEIQEIGLEHKLIVMVIGFILMFIIWVIFYNKKKKYEKNIEGIGPLSPALKLSGWFSIMKSIGKLMKGIIIGIIFVLVGLYLKIISGTKWPLILILFGILIIIIKLIIFWFHWVKSKVLTKGNYY